VNYDGRPLARRVNSGSDQLPRSADGRVEGDRGRWERWLGLKGVVGQQVVVEAGGEEGHELNYKLLFFLSFLEVSVSSLVMFFFHSNLHGNN